MIATWDGATDSLLFKDATNIITDATYFSKITSAEYTHSVVLATAFDPQSPAIFIAGGNSETIISDYVLSSKVYSKMSGAQVAQEVARQIWIG